MFMCFFVFCQLFPYTLAQHLLFNLLKYFVYHAFNRFCEAIHASNYIVHGDQQ